MTKLLAYDPFNKRVAWSEDDHQMLMVQWLRREGILFAADQNAGRRSARDGARRKALGMAAGDALTNYYAISG